MMVRLNRRLVVSPNVRLGRRARVPIERVREGQLAKIVGRIRCVGQPLTSPQTRRPCVYYRIQGIKHRSEFFVEERSQCFWVEDRSGQALVVLDAARFFVDYSWRVHGATDHARVDFARHGHAVHRGEEDMSVSEAVLESGEMVEVFGHCSWEHHPDSRHGT